MNVVPGILEITLHEDLIIDDTLAFDFFDFETDIILCPSELHKEQIIKRLTIKGRHWENFNSDHLTYLIVDSVETFNKHYTEQKIKTLHIIDWFSINWEEREKINLVNVENVTVNSSFKCHEVELVNDILMNCKNKHLSATSGRLANLCLEISKKYGPKYIYNEFDIL